ncbi:MAG: acyl-CoA synthetase [Vulcanisaeta sp.]|uniref:acyl-CoA synthetase n=1 Tax=Vulcanisaeta sp. TaxID=2020871 RepID=UPI003D1434C2
MSSSTFNEFLKQRNLLLNAGSYEEARSNFRWPPPGEFNWAVDYFDKYLAETSTNPALIYINDELFKSGDSRILSYHELRARSNKLANALSDLGIGRGDVIMVMLNNKPELFESFLALMKTGAVISPATTLLLPSDIEDRASRAHFKAIIADPEVVSRIDQIKGNLEKLGVKYFITLGKPGPGWLDYYELISGRSENFQGVKTKSDDLLLVYFTSGTTAKPKMVMHTQSSYPIGHLTTMYWVGAKPGYKHMNISSPGWAKWAWSTFFAAFNAGATTVVYDYSGRFSAANHLKILESYGIDTLCAPPTVWRMIILEDLTKYNLEKIKSFVSAGEPLNPEVIERVYKATGKYIRDGYGQTETTLMVGNFPGMKIKLGSMGKPAPGYDIVLVDEDGNPVSVNKDGHITVRTSPRPIGLMIGYDDENKNKEVFRLGLYFTGDVAFMDEEGYLYFVGRADDVFKSSDYRISPFELESDLLKHPAVAEAAVVPSPDPIRGFIPKAYIVLKPGYKPSKDLAYDIFKFIRLNIAPYKRPRAIEFVSELPKTISGKIRRVELRGIEREKRNKGVRSENEYFEDDFPDIKQLKV